VIDFLDNWREGKKEDGKCFFLKAAYIEVKEYSAQSILNTFLKI